MEIVSELSQWLAANSNPTAAYSQADIDKGLEMSRNDCNRLKRDCAAVRKRHKRLKVTNAFMSRKVQSLAQLEMDRLGEKAKAMGAQLAKVENYREDKMKVLSVVKWKHCWIMGGPDEYAERARNLLEEMADLTLSGLQLLAEAKLSLDKASDMLESTMLESE